ncbi:50S ribosomal protein L31 [Wolbachia endosymbiont of Cantharis cryptica]|uniref:50S ribosomal protein L31 n=1 Tax=Wolbachia endosymbiont of Cantharis cryptica TaxID=3066132 RepID=UPI00376F0356
MTEINYHKIIVVMTNGQKFETYSTYGEEGDTITLDIDPHNHPAWTGSLTSGSARKTKTGKMARLLEQYKKCEEYGDDF